jgi:predicted alpha/beta hydrolase family esterase
MAVVAPPERSVGDQAVGQYVYRDYNRKRVRVYIASSENDPHYETRQAQKAKQQLNLAIERLNRHKQP